MKEAPNINEGTQYLCPVTFFIFKFKLWAWFHCNAISYIFLLLQCCWFVCQSFELLFYVPLIVISCSWISSHTQLSGYYHICYLALSFCWCECSFNLFSVFPTIQFSLLLSYFHRCVHFCYHAIMLHKLLLYFF